VTPRLGVCSWSLRPTSPENLARKVRACGLARVQLALGPLRTRQWSERDTVQALAAQGISIASGMMSTHGEDYTTLDTIRETGGLRPDRHWKQNLAAAREDAALARRLGLGLVTFHAGFLPEERGDPERAKLLDRLRQVCDAFAEQGVVLGFETGQESATTLSEVLADLDHPAAGVNFDPANMILYGMGEPVAALELLREHVRQVHVKDALPARAPGTWGEEVPVGRGAVDWDRFLALVRELEVELMIERESGAERAAEIRGARELVERHLGPST
jgi:L-ribulose-5-phosphate 3-epimerase